MSVRFLACTSHLLCAYNGFDRTFVANHCQCIIVNCTPLYICSNIISILSDKQDPMHSEPQHQLVETLDTERLHLRHFTESDAQDVFEYASDKQTVKYLTWPAHTSVEMSKRIITNTLSSNGTYAIVLKGVAKVIGCIDMRIVLDTEASFGYVLNRAYWNAGYMSEALQKILTYMFTELNIEIVESCHEKGNPASGAVMKKCGMRWTHLAKGETLFGKISDNEHYC